MPRLAILLCLLRGRHTPEGPESIHIIEAMRHQPQQAPQPVRYTYRVRRCRRCGEIVRIIPDEPGLE